MGVYDLVRSRLSPTARFIAARDEALAATPGPSAARAALPFSGAPQGPGRLPPINWNSADQVPAQPPYEPRPGYTDHTFTAMAAPYGWEGWDLERIHRAIAAHSQGWFWESSLLMLVLLRFGPVLAALQQAIAPIASLPRHLHGGDKGISKLVAEELEEALLPAHGLLPSVYLPPTLIPSLAITLRMMGAGTLQHVDGDMDPELGIRPRFTRIFPEWAINAYRSPRKVIALTSEGPIEVCNDGKFTRVQDEEEGYFSGAIVALGDQTFAGKIVQAAQVRWLDYFGSPKMFALLPELIATGSTAGIDFRQAIADLYGPDGFATLPHGSDVKTVKLEGTGTDKFTPALSAAVAYIYMILTGSTGTMGPGGPTGEGPYQAKEGGFWNVRHDLMERPIRAILTGLNGGHIDPYCRGNYAEEIRRAAAQKKWAWPRMTIPLVAPDRDARIAGVGARQKLLVEVYEMEMGAGADPAVAQARVNRLAELFEADPFPVGAKTTEPLADADRAKAWTVNEVRERDGKPLLSDERGTWLMVEAEAVAKAKAAQRAQGAEQEGGEGGSPAEPPGQPPAAPPPPGEPPAQPGSSTPASGAPATGEGPPSTKRSAP